MECSHVDSVVLIAAKDIDSKHWVCIDCQSSKSPWICLTCGSIRCGRYVSGHAKKHAELHPTHSLCMDQALQIYCYSHDEFVINDSDCIQQIRKRVESFMRNIVDDDDYLPPVKSLKYDKNIEPLRTVGLCNLGNTCFMNAILQSLSNIEQLRRYFNTKPPCDESLKGAVKKNHTYHTRNSISQDVSLVEEFRKLLISLWESTCAVSPDSLFSAVWKLVPKFRGYQQQDAHEFLRYLLDKLNDELCQTLSANSSIVSDVFGGVLQSDVNCLICLKESQKLDPILDLSLDIPVSHREKCESTSCTLINCLTSYTCLEYLSENDWYYCPHCRRKQPSTKYLSIHSLPNVLCIHLKRFRSNSYYRTKLGLLVTFPLTGLNMAPYSSIDNEDLLYDLVSVVIHHGSGVSSGHYTTCTYSPISKCWYHFSDTSVMQVDESWVSKCKAYILFYVRQEQKKTLSK